MKKYIFEKKFLLIGTITFSALFSLGCAFIGILLTEISDIAISSDANSFYITLMKMAVFFLALGIAFYIYSILSKKFLCSIIKSIRSDAFEGISKRSISDFGKVNSADYLSAITNDVKIIEENFLNPLLMVLQSIVLLVASIGVMIYLSPLVTFCLILTVVFLIVIPALFGKPLQKRQDKYSNKLSDFTIKIKDILSGFEVIKSYSMRDYITGDFNKENSAVISAKYSVDKLYALTESVSMVLGIVSQISVVFVSAYLIMKGQLSPGTLIGLVQVSAGITSPIQMIAQNMSKIQSTKPIINRILQLSEYSDDGFTGKSEPYFEQGLAVKGLTFSYNDKEILKKLNLNIEKNKKYAIVGKSGSGKSTLVKLISGYYSKYDGEIAYDNLNIKDIDISKLNEMHAIIHQNVYMFDEALEDNICLHKDFSQEKIKNALSLSGVDLFIDNLENGLRYSVGENGFNLSGGQRQRVAVARALIQKKPILILDEGTSAIDVQTAYDIESKLLDMDDITLLTITHNISEDILGRYDEIILIEDGVVVEKGTYKQLIELESKFYDFYNLKK